MTPTPPPVPTIAPGFVVLDLDLPERPPLAEADDYKAGLHMLTAVQEEFYDQLDANGEGGHRARLALIVAPIDATGAIGPACYWAIINGMRPAERINGGDHARHPGLVGAAAQPRRRAVVAEAILHATGGRRLPVEHGQPTSPDAATFLQRRAGTMLERARVR